MAGETTEARPSLPELFTRHLEVLNEHARVLSVELSARSNEPDNPLRRLIQSCAKDTKRMIKMHENLKSAYLNHTPDVHATKSPKRNSGDLNGQPASKKTKQTHEKNESKDSNIIEGSQNGTSTPIVNDASGLFTIDSNPTPVEELLKNNSTQQSKKKPPRKRRRSSQDQLVPVPTKPSTSAGSENAASTKRKKIKYTGNEDNPQDQEQMQSGTQEKDKDEDEAYAEAFEQKVALRLKEKDEVQKKKANKKRKRESNASVPDEQENKPKPQSKPVNPELARYLEPTPKPSKRRKQMLKAEAVAADASQEGIMLGEKTKVADSKKRRKKSS